MNHMLDELFCQLLHGRWARVISYSGQGAWQCDKDGCAAQARHDAARSHVAPRRFETVRGQLAAHGRLASPPAPVSHRAHARRFAA
jgi:hypothetical protein